ncbi:hypothetical protein BC937DRAFT_93873, partial [Endogone sp. FLAS-F59071]
TVQSHNTTLNLIAPPQHSALAPPPPPLQHLTPPSPLASLPLRAALPRPTRIALHIPHPSHLPPDRSHTEAPAAPQALLPPLPPPLPPPPLLLPLPPPPLPSYFSRPPVAYLRSLPFDRS